MEQVSSDITDSDPEFDRTMQEMLWHEARDSLQDTAHIASFRLVFANIIFALTQKPLDVTKSLSSLKTAKNGIFEDVDNDESSQSRRAPPEHWRDDPRNSVETSSTIDVASQSENLLEDILELEGPPIFLERALRQMFSYRRRLEKLESQERTNKTKPQGQYSLPTPDEACGPLGVADRQTFNLLFWLAIMFDTLSAAINKIPLVVSDKDSDILKDESIPSTQQNPGIDQIWTFSDTGCSRNSDHTFAKSNDSELWGDFFFHNGSVCPKEIIVHWPCSYEIAAATLCDAAPIKVVLFRRVTRLQTLLSRRTRPEKLEVAIDDALRVHDYWNNKYGPFFRDCISNHETLPPRIQSWYIVLAGHWHLAGLILADTIEELDELHAGLENCRLARDSQRLIQNLRLHNAFSISDLGKCSCPAPNSSFSRAAEFHSAVNNGALLTEPWTEVLTQSFSKACSVLLKMFPKLIRDRSFDVDLFSHRSESCVRALWYLGRKSDIALLASNVLLEALKQKVSDVKKASSSNFDESYGVTDDGVWDGMEEWGTGELPFDSMGNYVGCI